MKEIEKIRDIEGFLNHLLKKRIKHSIEVYSAILVANARLKIENRELANQNEKLTINNLKLLLTNN